MAQQLVGAKWVSGASVEDGADWREMSWVAYVPWGQAEHPPVSFPFLCLFFLSQRYPLRRCPVRARLVGLTLGSASQMLPWGKQKHLSPAQPWLSLSDKSWGCLCQHCPACHLSPSYTISPTQPLHRHRHTHTHFTLFAPVRLHPDSVTEAGGSLPFCPLAFYALVLGWHIYAESEKSCRPKQIPVERSLYQVIQWWSSGTQKLRAAVPFNQTSSLQIRSTKFHKGQ